MPKTGSTRKLKILREKMMRGKKRTKPMISRVERNPAAPVFFCRRMPVLNFCLNFKGFTPCRNSSHLRAPQVIRRACFRGTSRGTPSERSVRSGLRNRSAGTRRRRNPSAGKLRRSGHPERTGYAGPSHRNPLRGLRKPPGSGSHRSGVRKGGRPRKRVRRCGGQHRAAETAAEKKEKAKKKDPTGRSGFLLFKW